MTCARCKLFLVVLSLTGLLACSSEEGPYRDQSAPIGATTRFTPQEFAGNWVIAASFQQRRKAPVAVTYSEDAQRLAVTSDELAEVAGFYRQGVAGELIPFSDEQETLVVMWVDAEFRTAVVGTESGSIGVVLDREGDVPNDRAKAARNILEFYGWDTSQLKRAF